jgi:hypothetical protein
MASCRPTSPPLLCLSTAFVVIPIACFETLEDAGGGRCSLALALAGRRRAAIQIDSFPGEGLHLEILISLISGSRLHLCTFVYSGRRHLNEPEEQS